MNKNAKKQNKSKIIRHVAAIGTSGLLLAILTACVSPGTLTAVDVTINVTFEPKSSSDPTLCPVSVDKPNPAVYRNKFVTWQAVDSNGADINEGFEIYFDPIQAAPLFTSNGKMNKKIDAGAPTVEYKYTVWDRVTGNDPHKCDPLDPRFRVY